MKMSAMLLIAALILDAGGIGKRTLTLWGAGRKRAAFFLLCVLALSCFEFEPFEDASVNAACILIPVWTFGCAYSDDHKTKHRYLIIPVSLIAGTIAGALPSPYSVVLTAFASSTLTILFGLVFGWAAGTLIPAVSSLFIFVYSLVRSGYGSFELGESCLSVQLLALLSSFASEILIKRDRTTVRLMSHDRTNR